MIQRYPTFAQTLDLGCVRLQLLRVDVVGGTEAADVVGGTEAADVVGSTGSTEAPLLCFVVDNPA